MTQENSSETTPKTETGSGDLFNTAAGWVLFAAGLGLGLSILSGKYFHGDSPERPEQLGYVIEGVIEEGGGEAEMTMAAALAMPDTTVAAGEKIYAKCQACHTINQGGANGVGPNLYGIMGSPIGKHAAGYDYSAAMASFGGQWGWEEMNAWLKNPKGYIEGTKMGFAGLSKIEDRAALALYLNSQGSGLPVPEYVEAVAEGAEEAEAETDEVAAAEADQGELAASEEAAAAQ
ncbi:cytochrome c family protein [Erythrobacter sp. JK5]|uniref:c-type cytochrome n=1 Tax=Erythrobacter sp. JK5 TaxID=2829500 RepID=UPI001BA7D65D|nr:cytochrome c family protein [Erythrobacter sp. JK5]QUL37784.1 cytochrome c family protein [Erythrobacter sp. JK5]